MHQFDRSILYLCCMLPSVNDCKSHVQKATIVELAIKRFYKLVN